MARRLTTFSKFLITLLILAAIVFLGRYILNSTKFGERLKEESAEATDRSGDNGSSAARVDDDETLVVQIFTWGGYAPGLYFNEGASPNANSRFQKDYGLKVKFELIDDFNASRQAWVADRVNLIGGTIDALPVELEGLGQYNPVAVLQSDWSRGGDAIVVKRGINSVNDLKGKQVAVTPTTPSQTFLISLLDAANMDLKDVKVVETPDNFAAATAFKSGSVDAAVVWSPDDIIAVREVPGSKVLQSTKTASHIIADIFIGKRDYVAQNRDKINAFYEGWMRGAAEINSNQSNRQKAAKIMGETMNLSQEDALGAMDNVYLCTHGDNVNFFGLNTQYKGITGEHLYTRMGERFEQLGFAPANRPTYRQVIYSGGAQTSSLSGFTHQAESQPEFAPATSAEREAPAVATKPISINFNTGQYALSENAKTLIDLQFADIARSFANARVRVEGNTDNVGARQMNMDLSRKRAQSVARYLQETYGMSANRFIVVGNGPDKPVAGCASNNTEACRARNRRTEFQIISG